MSKIKDALKKLPNLYEMDAKPAKAPAVKLFNAYGAGTWFVSEYNPDTGEAFGIADLGMGCPEYGYISVPELESLTMMAGALPMIEVDLYFDGTLADGKKALGMAA